MDNINLKDLYLIKFIDQQYINDFINKGQVHFSTISEINKLEENVNDTQGDLYEGKLMSESDPLKVQLFFKLAGSNDKPRQLPFSSVQSTVTYPALQKKVIASFASLNIMNDFYQTEDGYKIKEDTIKGLKDISGDRPCVLFPLDGFLKLIKRYSKQHDHIGYNFVKYKDRDFSEIAKFSNLEAEEAISELAFTKRKKYAEQKEFRFLINNEFEESINIELGSLKDLNMKKLSGISELNKLRIIDQSKSHSK